MLLQFQTDRAHTLKPTLNPNFCAFVGSRVAPPCAHARSSWRCEGHRSRSVRRPSATAAWGFTPCRFMPNDRKSRLHHSDSGEHRRTRMHAVSTWRASRGAEHAPLGAIQARDVRGIRPGRGGTGESGGGEWRLFCGLPARSDLTTQRKAVVCASTLAFHGRCLSARFPNTSRGR